MQAIKEIVRDAAGPDPDLEDASFNDIFDSALEDNS